MAVYNHLLVALALEPKSDEFVIAKAEKLRSQFDGDITLVHSVEHLSNYGAAYGISAGIDIEEILLEEAKKSMKEVAARMNISDSRQVVKVGPAKQIILEEADEKNIDLIVVGSHGRHGVRLLLGSTANAVLHGAKCDVLAVRVRD